MSPHKRICLAVQELALAKFKLCVTNEYGDDDEIKHFRKQRFNLLCCNPSLFEVQPVFGAISVRPLQERMSFLDLFLADGSKL